MKRFMLLLVSLLALLFMNSLAFAQQDTTLTVTSNGNVGIGTTTPQGPLHVKGISGTDSPTILIEKSSSMTSSPRLGFVDTAMGPVTSAPVWFIDNFNDRFRIFREPSINTPGFESMTITNTGNVGIGTGEPGEKLDIVGNLDVNGVIHGQRDTGSGDVIFLGNDTKLIDINIENTVGLYGLQDTTQGHIQLGSSGQIISGVNGNVGIGITTPSQPLQMASGAHVTIGGVWTYASSRALKENIRDLTGDEAAWALSQLAPKRYNYKVEKSEEYLGFIAEDVPELVATGNRKSLSPMDIVAVLTKVLQEQQKKIAELEARLISIQ